MPSHAYYEMLSNKAVDLFIKKEEPSVGIHVIAIDHHHHRDMNRDAPFTWRWLLCTRRFISLFTIL